MTTSSDMVDKPLAFVARASNSSMEHIFLVILAICSSIADD